MTKNIIKYFIPVFLVFMPLTAQSGKDSIDIKALVRQQIVAAKEKQNREILQKPEPYKAEVSANALTDQKAGFDPVYIKGGILLLAALIASGFILKRRLKIRKIEKKLSLKKNIKAIREEQLVKEIDPLLKSIRKRLCLTSDYLNKPEKEVIIAAKKLNLAKEELMLASRLNKFRVNDKMEVTV